ncbi:hypothetical protein BV25DRAFT_1986350 [Artomyces pyxidatus]|uniref:Uncharacterized protein n=1 Tax=Artomyces pyxidatus TaxID=48021 RepID=A0ACB8TK69_9AGAM|nr:hypothetical protein BV25DRAFT_1986350 [Artomyces pyxidatus]
MFTLFRTFTVSMAKRTSSLSFSSSPAKKTRPADVRVVHNKVATAEAAAKVDGDPPLGRLIQALEECNVLPVKGHSVVYWMRMEDMRICDNRALAAASAMAIKEGIPLLVLFVLSPQDYVAHDRSPRRIDFTLRNLALIKASLSDIDIPLHVVTHKPRRDIPSFVISFLRSMKATRLFANMEYEVDELRRDIQVCELGKDEGISPMFIHDKLIIEPGVLTSKQGKPYAVYSPFQRLWLSTLNGDLDKYLAEASSPEPNPASVRQHPTFSGLFSTELPTAIDGFDCADRDQMATVWPAGTIAAREMLRRFLYTKSRSSHVGLSDPLEDGAVSSDKRSRALVYKEGRDKADRDTTSRLSPYLSAGVISARECVRATLILLGAKKVQATRDTSVGVWVQEIAWRDFYTHVMAAFPRVSMGRPFQEKYADVQWETNQAHFDAWKEGRTGVPIVDAAMRQANTMGWMHNRPRMIAAMYLTKDLMLDWRLGERYFMEQFIDGDLGSNNGGWQWSASTGTDPQPYFRIFNPYSQSEKADPTGDYIRAFVPELREVFGPDVHNPPAKLADKLGYPRPLVDHKEARERALRRYKNPGVQ